MTLTILEGSTFCICDERGDIGGETSGFFAEDTRFLSRFTLTVNGERPLLLSSDKVEYFSAAFYLRNPLAGGLEQDALSIVRERFVGDGMQDRIAVRNESAMEPVAFELALEVAADFADIFSVKEHDFSLGDPLRARAAAAAGRGALRRGDERSSCSRTRTRARRRDAGRPLAAGRASTTAIACAIAIELAPRERWELRRSTSSRARRAQRALPRRRVERRFGDELAHVRDSLAAWQLRVPQLRATLGRARARVRPLGRRPRLAAHARHRRRVGEAAGRRHALVHDRVRPRHDHHVPADAALRARSSRARRSRRSPSSRRARTTRRSTPSPARSSTRCGSGKAARDWFRAYYGTVDATPLYLVLLSEVWRWTDDAALVAPAARAGAARARVDRPAGATATATASSSTSGAAERGLEVQSWKDSGDSQRFADGTLAARADRAVRGAGLRLRREAAHGRARARGLARPRRSPSGSSARRTSCGERFDEAFWVDERRRLLRARARRRQAAGRLALLEHRPPALERDRPAGARRRDRRRARSGDGLWSGWGVRTMSTGDAAYNPLAYHNGTRLAARQLPDRVGARALRRAGRRRTGSSARMLDAASYFDYQLPEVFAGLPRVRDAVPDRRTRPRRGRRRGRPATPVLLLQLLLGLQPDRAPPRARQRSRRRSCRAGPGTSALSGVRAFDRLWDVRARGRRGRGGGGVTRRPPAGRRLSPPWFPVPPTGYGGIEWVVSLLADGLADAGHDVTLFASGDSHTKARLAVGLPSARRASGSGTRFWELQARRSPASTARRRVRRHQRPHRACSASRSAALVDTPFVHTVHGPLDGEPGELYEQVVARRPRTRG